MAVPRLPRRVVGVVGELLVVVAVLAATTQVAEFTSWAAGLPGQPMMWPESWPVFGVAAVVMVGRRWLPVVALLAAAVLFGRYPQAGMVVALVACAAIRHATVRARRTAVLLLVAMVLPVAVVLVGVPVQRWRYVAGVVGVCSVVCVAVPGLAGTLLGQHDRLVAALRDRASFLERARRLAESEARLRERSRIAEEMHDLIGHRLSLVSLHAGALELASASTSTEAGGAARLIRTTVRTALEELREVLGVLRGGQGSEERATDATGTRADVALLVEQSRAAGLDVTLEWVGPDTAEVGGRVRRALHRIVREGLTNVHRHAPAASTRLTVTHSADEVQVVLHNDTAAGGGLPRGGYGLTALAERVRLLGGALTAGADRAGGFTLTATLPLERTAPMPAVESETEAPPPAGAGRFAGLRTATVLSAGLLGVGVVLALTLSTVAPPVPGGVVDNEVREGMSRAEVEQIVGADQPLARAAVADREPARPADADCLYVQSDGPEGAVHVAQFCFTGDALVDIADIPVPDGG